MAEILSVPFISVIVKLETRVAVQYTHGTWNRSKKNEKIK
jgi:hypothetical protein